MSECKRRRWTDILISAAAIVCLLPGAAVYYSQPTNAQPGPPSVIVKAGGSGSGVSGLTATRVPFAQDATTLVDDADMTFATNKLTVTRLRVDPSQTSGSGDVAIQLGATTDGWYYEAANKIHTRIAGSDVGRFNGSTYGFSMYANEHVTVTTSVTTSHTNAAFTINNNGDTDGMTVTLQNNPDIGHFWRIAVDASQTITIQPSAGETMYGPLGGVCATLTCASRGCTITLEAMLGGSGGFFATTGFAGTWGCS